MQPILGPDGRYHDPLGEHPAGYVTTDGKHHASFHEAHLHQQALESETSAPEWPTKIYFIKRECRGGPIKIGFASNVRQRLSVLQVGSPDRLILLATEPGGRAKEEELHSRFREARLGGEWFAPCKELLTYITSLNRRKR